MHRFRCLIAAFLAILIASPLCCCASLLPAKETARHECCGHSQKKENKETTCACPSKGARAIEKQAALPDAVVAALLPPVLDLLPAMISARTAEPVSVPTLIVDTGPSRERLLRLRSLLI
jgi:hypothetical protein